MEKIVKFLNRNMIWETLIIMVISIILGKHYHSFFVKLKPLLPFALFLMLYKPMTYLELDKLFKGSAHIQRKYIFTLTVLYCFVFPFSTYVLMKTILWILPNINNKWVAGIVLLSLSPIASSTPAFVEMCNGDIQLALIGVIYTFLLSLFVVPIGSKLILSKVVTVSLFSLLKSLIFCIGIPLAVGQITKYLITKYMGKKALKNLKTPFSILVYIGLFLMVFIVFGINGKVIAEQPHIIIYGVLIMNLYFLIRWLLTFTIGNLLKFPAKQNIALTYSSTYNMTIATAIGIATFGPSAAVGTVIGGPFAEMIQMILLVEFLRWYQKQ